MTPFCGKPCRCEIAAGLCRTCYWVHLQNSRGFRSRPRCCLWFANTPGRNRSQPSGTVRVDAADRRAAQTAAPRDQLAIHSRHAKTSLCMTTLKWTLRRSGSSLRGIFLSSRRRCAPSGPCWTSRIKAPGCGRTAPDTHRARTDSTLRQRRHGPYQLRGGAADVAGEGGRDAEARGQLPGCGQGISPRPSSHPPG